jgi:hypothetical protein
VDDLEYYQWEWEHHGRVRKNIKEILSSSNVHDFETFVLPRLADDGRVEEFQRVYDWFIRHGYEFKGKSK